MCPRSGTAVVRLKRGVVNERIGARSRIPDKNQVTLLGADSGYEVGSTSGPGDANTKRSRGDDFIPQNLKGYGPILQMIEVSNFLQSLVQISVNIACARCARAAAIGPTKLRVGNRRIVSTSWSNS